MIILGIDPGYAIVGWGVIDYNGSSFKTIDYGAVTTPAGMAVEQRLKLIWEALVEIIEKYKPDCMAVEQLFWNTNQKTGIVVAEARGIILLSAVTHGLEIYEYTPLQVKQSVVGYGRAEKKQIISMTTMMLGLKKPPKPDDTADALAIAICHAHSSGSLLAAALRKK